MVIEYREDAGTRDICRVLLTLPLIPHSEIVGVFGWLEEGATTAPRNLVVFPDLPAPLG